MASKPLIFLSVLVLSLSACRSNKGQRKICRDWFVSLKDSVTLGFLECEGKPNIGECLKAADEKTKAKLTEYEESCLLKSK